MWVPAVAQQDVTRDPDRVRLEVGDIRRLAQVLRSIKAGEVTDTAAVIEREYIAKASPGLRAYAESHRVTAASITSALAAQPSRYADLDALADAVLAQEQAFRSAFRKLQDIFPGAVFPPVWFVVGHSGPGGLARPEGLLIATERFTSRPEDLVPLVLHELSHFQQAMVQGVDTYRRIYGPEQTLLALALREGSAELIAKLTTGQHTNPAAERYGMSREAQLWSRFQKEMHRREPGDWMFVRPANTAQPADVGYWIGYRIAKSYYDQAGDKRKAVRDILALTDFGAFLPASRYAERMKR
jgi:hypothetical protein